MNKTRPKLKTEVTNFFSSLVLPISVTNLTAILYSSASLILILCLLYTFISLLRTLPFVSFVVTSHQSLTISHPTYCHRYLTSIAASQFPPVSPNTHHYTVSDLPDVQLNTTGSYKNKQTSATSLTAHRIESNFFLCPQRLYLTNRPPFCSTLSSNHVQRPTCVFRNALNEVFFK